MKIAKLFFLVCIGIKCSLLQGDVHAIMTSALISRNYDERKLEYLKCLYTLRSYGLDPWIIEATKIDDSFFNEVSDRVLYPKCQDFSLKNKGVNETMSLRLSLKNLPFQDEDIVIKMTGRYFLYRRDLIDLINETHSDYDAYVCSGKHFIPEDQIFTGCFAVRWKYFREMIEEMDLEKIERIPISVEEEFADLIRKKQLRVKVVHPLYVLANIDFPGFGMMHF